MRAVVAGIGLVFITILIGTAITLSAFISPSGRYMMPLGRLWSRWILAIAGVRVEFSGVGLAQARHGQSVVYVSNHLSNLDIPCIALAMPDNLRFLAKKSLSYIPFFGWAMLATGGCIFIDRGHHAGALLSLERASQRVRAGASLLVFPEGTRSRDGALREFKKGAFHLASAAQVPVVPIAVTGTRELMPIGSLRIRSGVVRVRFGHPIAVHPDTPAAELASAVHTAIAELLATG